MDAAEASARWCVVTGGRGFAARHLVLMLLRSGEWRVRVADLAQVISLDRDEEQGILGAAIREGQAVYASADLRDKAQLAKGVCDPPLGPQIVRLGRVLVVMCSLIPCPCGCGIWRLVLISLRGCF
jgi:hypothetical protein